MLIINPAQNYAIRINYIKAKVQGGQKKQTEIRLHSLRVVLKNVKK